MDLLKFVSLADHLMLDWLSLTLDVVIYSFPLYLCHFFHIYECTMVSCKIPTFVH